MPSSTMVVAPIIGTLLKAEDILGKDRVWTPTTPTQSHFLNNYFAHKNELAQLSEKELRSWASYSADELNAIVRKEKFDFKFYPFRRDQFGVLSILDVLVEWIESGAKTTLAHEDKEYPAVRMKRGFSVYERPQDRLLGAGQPVAMIHTKSGDRVYIMQADANTHEDGFDLLTQLRSAAIFLPTRLHYDTLIFPMVDINHMVDINWIIGMKTNSQDGVEYEVIQAAQQTKLKMNEKGARVKSAVGMTIGITSIRIPKILEIKPPFYLWIERDGMTTPILTAYISEEDCKDPGNLDDM